MQFQTKLKVTADDSGIKMGVNSDKKWVSWVMP